MTDLISRADAMAACQKIADESKAYGIPQMTMGANTCRDAIRALPAAQVGVWPMEWVEYHTDRFYALGINCEYKIDLNHDGSAKWQYKHMGKWQDARSLQDAKDLAQAHCIASIGEWLIGGEA